MYASITLGPERDIRPPHHRGSILNRHIPAISIIVPVRNQRAYNECFLDSLRRTARLPYELIAIDNGSTDGSPELFEQAGARVIRNDGNRCYGCSMNQGIARSSAPAVAFLNNDIIMSAGWDERLLQYLDEYGLDVISPCGSETLESPDAIRNALHRWKRVNAVVRLRQKIGRAGSIRPMFLVRAMYGNWDRFTQRRAERFHRFLYPGLSGFALVARRSLFDRIGRWSEEISASDFDLWLRIMREHIAGHGIYQPMIAGDVIFHHFIRTTSHSVKDPYRCTHPLAVFDEKYPAQERLLTQPPRISVVVAVYNRPDFLEKVLAGLRNQSFTDFEVVVADDGSGPEIAQVITAHKNVFSHPLQHVRHNDDGFRKTIIANQAVRRARGGYLVFIDGDAVCHHRFLSEHWRNRCVGTVLSGRRIMLDADLTGRLTRDDISLRRIERASFWMRHCDPGTRKYGLYAPMSTKIENTARRSRNYHILGSNFSLCTGDFYRINGYDERIIGRGLEDDNLANRFKTAGIRIRSVARSALQYHLHHDADPIPHDAAMIRTYGHPADAWSSHGIIKAGGPYSTPLQKSDADPLQ